METEMIEFLRLPTVLNAGGKRRSSHYADVQRGLFIRQVRLGDNSVGWPRHEVEAINAARLAGKSDDEIRALVQRLEAARKNLAGSP
jgi:prophage regulatory protein